MWDEISFREPGEDLSGKAKQIKEDIDSILKRRLIAQAHQMRAKVEVSCAEFDGIDAIKDALFNGTKASVDECEVKVKLIAHSIFMLSCQCRDEQIGFITLRNAIALVEETIVSKRGKFKLRTRPELVGQQQYPGQCHRFDRGDHCFEEG